MLYATSIPAEIGIRRIDKGVVRVRWLALEKPYQRFDVGEEDEEVIEGKAEISSESPPQIIAAARPGLSGETA